ncbi:four-carbon acid sugar kinase family protein [Auraticoccus monumenti]|uniref:Uncharacterized conserved protein YgbK, DUF1537 family n=1 Tax=Auraticoccus monumenti TaxID=675864 RepID=A0A1G6UFI2_9ACTN|nr:four-carbon acid sugar kinase family protein [Auraticoccus monumenti]SDD39466.1 Uncharacterized conserved protein YgbK, DUF1537 family [Auraticoccus monumenti]
MLVLVLDDDPTGSQSATGVEVLLDWDTDTLTDALGSAPAVYLLTNTRAVAEAEAVALVHRTRDMAAEAGRRLGERVHLVLRGDSTLRGHVFAEAAAVDDRAPLLFVPAFPGGGRTTVDGTHLVRVGGRTLPAHETEFAADPVFGYRSGHLPDYVREHSDREPVLLPIEVVRDPAALVAALVGAGDGQVLLPDVHDDADVERLAVAVRTAWTERELVVRGGAPIAAAVAGVTSAGLLPTPVTPSGRTLLVCGSHTSAATRQLAVAAAGRRAPCVIDTDAALADGPGEVDRLVSEVAPALADGFAALASERVRRPEHHTLAHGESVMRVLVGTVAALRDDVEVVVSKGGITGAEVARAGLGAARARVRGQVLPGVSVWDLSTPAGRPVVLVVVPGNVGEDDTLDTVLRAVST